MRVQPLTLDRWADFEGLFGKRGACGGCWCMWWRIARSDFEKNKGAGNKRAMRRIVQSGKVPGLIGYINGEPVGWCSIAPREEYPVLARSRVLKPVDDKRVWSVVCFFIAKPYRRCGLGVAMLNAAVEYAATQGARLVEGYPVEPRKDPMPDAFAWVGLASLFRRAGFTEAARRSPTRPIMRRQRAEATAQSMSTTVDCLFAVVGWVVTGLCLYFVVRLVVIRAIETCAVLGGFAGGGCSEQCHELAVPVGISISSIQSRNPKARPRRSARRFPVASSSSTTSVDDSLS